MMCPRGFLTADVEGHLDLRRIVSFGQEKTASFLPSSLVLSSYIPCHPSSVTCFLTLATLTQEAEAVGYFETLLSTYKAS